ncbi:Ig-like domain-containing protein [Solwaraspora sp. WMMD406]|uniref:Ig-like domain-containing protein n=1 Tax=Solwaraspora sp. WMMD406 TaxID=3016095 RepID=UPI00241735FE|nr:Ig-like domain-containing protein [Solwaraspora sp. WMMD406]MDG4766885.1 Ig-like domain-containing protein [Solwaraspora sp. WMMD406]
MRRRRAVAARAVATAVALATVAAVTAAVALAPTHRPAYAAPACTVDYQLTREWSNGFLADLTLTNLGAPLSDWALEFRMPAGQQMNYGLSVLPAGVRMNIVFGPVILSATETAPELPTGGTVHVVLGGHYQGDRNAQPTEFLFNGLRCNAEDPTASPTPPVVSPSPSPGDPLRPTVAVTSPQPNEVFSVVTPVLIAARATAAPGRRIARVEFRAGGTLLHTDTTAPYEFSWNDATPTDVLRIAATAYDDAGGWDRAEVRGIRVIPATPPGTAPALTVSGNQIVALDDPTRPYRLRGVVRAGAEALCVAGTGIWDGPVDDASVAAMTRWRVDAVRILVDDRCWLDGAMEPSPYRGAAYRAEITGYAHRLADHGITPIIAPRGPQTGDPRSFWADVARELGSDNRVLFDLYGEHFPAVGDIDPAVAWSCWRDGSGCRELGWPEYGTQELIRRIRTYGGFNVLLAGGLDGANDLSGWSTYRPADPDGRKIAAAWRVDNRSSCATPACWAAQVGPVAAEVPLVATEVSEDTGGHRFTDRVIDWLDTRRLGYLGSVWHTDGYADVPPLIRDYQGRPTRYGAGLKAQLRQ